jgi:phosphate-selective porin
MKRAALAFLALFALPTPTPAQDPPDLYGIQYGSPDTFAEFHGFVNLEFYKFEHQPSSFDLHNFYFNAIAKVRKNITAFGEVEYEHGFYGDPGNLKLDRAFIDWRLGEPFALRIGKFYSPFGLEIRNYQAPVRRLVSRPLLADELLYDEWTEVGVNAYGTLGSKRLKLAYDVAVTNGPRSLAADGTQGRDNNSDKAVIGRVSLRPSMGEYGFVEMGLSWARGRYDDDGRRAAHHAGVDGRVYVRGVDLVAEFVRRTGDDQIGPDGRIRARGEGYYVQAGYYILRGRAGAYSVEPLVRYERSDLPDHDPAAEEPTLERWTGGLNYSPYQHFRFKAEYQLIRGVVRKEKTHGVMAAVVADF